MKSLTKPALRADPPVFASNCSSGSDAGCETCGTLATWRGSDALCETTTRWHRAVDRNGRLVGRLLECDLRCMNGHVHSDKPAIDLV
jgi:hypothetical protein